MTSRRRFLGQLAGGGLAGAGLARLVRDGDAVIAAPFLEGAATPLEDLMQEHAVLERVLLVYEAVRDRLAAGATLAPELPARAAAIVRRYIEDHHERDEERHLFPRLEQVGVELALIATLRTQHAAGRRLTGEILDRAGAAASRDPADRAALATALTRFVRMYRPHAARENTVLFPAFRRAVGQPEYERLRDTLERDECGGGDLFAAMLGETCALEAALGIAALDDVTPA